VAGDPPFTKQIDAFKSFFTTPTTHITYAATWFTLAIIGFILTRNMYAPTKTARATAAMGEYMLKQQAREATKKGAVLGLGIASVPLVVPQPPPESLERVISN
jgi:hypothetical protein